MKEISLKHDSYFITLRPAQHWGYILREFASDTQWTDKETRIARRNTHFGETNRRGKRFYDRNLSLPTQSQDGNHILIKDVNKQTIRTHWN